MPELLETVGPRSGGAPLIYRLAEQGTVELQAAFAHFDGTGASGAWRPALTVRAQNGTIISRTFPSDTLAAGDTADVTYAPFVPAASAAAPSGGGIQFDTDPQAGGWLLETMTSHVNKSEIGLGTVPWGLHVELTEANARALLKSLGPQLMRSVGGITAEASADGSYSDATLAQVVVNPNIVALNAGLSGAGATAAIVALSTAAGGPAVLFAVDTGGFIFFQAQSDGFELARFNADGSASITLRTGKTLTVQNNAGNPVFRVNENGDLQGLTGKALTFNL